MSILFLGTIITFQSYHFLKHNEYQDISYVVDEDVLNGCTNLAVNDKTIINIPNIVPTFTDNSQNTSNISLYDASTSPMIFDVSESVFREEDLTVYRSLDNDCDHDSDHEEYIKVSNSPPKGYIAPVVNLISDYLKQNK